MSDIQISLSILPSLTHSLHLCLSCVVKPGAPVESEQVSMCEARHSLCRRFLATVEGPCI